MDERRMWVESVLNKAVTENVMFSRCRIGEFNVVMAYDQDSCEYALSICSPKDRFDRGYGRAVAYERMRSPRGGLMTGVRESWPSRRGDWRIKQALMDCERAGLKMPKGMTEVWEHVLEE